jgi:hypothetical protein
VSGIPPCLSIVGGHDASKAFARLANLPLAYIMWRDTTVIEGNIASSQQDNRVVEHMVYVF